jgi:GNAT superfamily N-acetyltransferase
MPPTLTISVRRLGRADWPTLRSLRLQALADAPHAFLGDPLVEARSGQAGWEARFEGVAWFAAFLPGDGRGSADQVPVGLVSSLRDPDSDDRYLESMWVSDGFHGRGVARALIDAIKGLARSEGKAMVRLWVLDGNGHAARVYTHYGFSTSGNRQAVPGHPELMETEFYISLPLARPAANQLIETR